jgi:hypothetical protein
VAAAIGLMALLVVAVLRDSPLAVNSVVQNSAPNSGTITIPRNGMVPVRRNLLVARTDHVVTYDSVPYVGLVQLAAGAWDEVTLLVRPERKTTQQPEATSRSAATEGWIDGLQHQLTPIGRGLDNAFDFLWQAGQAGDG